MNFERFLEKRRKTLPLWITEPPQSFILTANPSLEVLQSVLTSLDMVARPETERALLSLLGASTGTSEAPNPTLPSPLPEVMPTTANLNVVPSADPEGLDAVDDDVVAVNGESADNLNVSALVGSALPRKPRVKSPSQQQVESDDNNNSNQQPVSS